MRTLISVLVILLFSTATYAAEGSRPWMQLVAEGAIPGYSVVEKFGENPEIDIATDPEDVWSHGGLYTFSTTADIDSIVSDDADDDQEITVQGLDEDWELVTQTVTLNGQTRVALSTDLIRCFRMWNADTTALEGDVHVYVDSTISSGVVADATKIRSGILTGSGQTEMAIYTVPAGYIGYLYQGYTGLSRGSYQAAAEFVPAIREFGGVWRTVFRISEIGQGTSAFTYTYPIPRPLAAKTDIKVMCVKVTADDTGVFAGFTIVLKYIGE